MRVAVVQFDPKIGQVQENIAKAHKLCEQLQPGSVDLVCLPEMIFSGYVFPDAAAISPFLEEPRTGPTSRFCAALAARLRCYVVGGYPERLPAHEVHTAVITDEDTGARRDVEQVGANAAALFGPDGSPAGHYRKTNLYKTDMTWALPGTGFAAFALPPPLGALALAICMDLNPQPPAVWTDLAHGPYELAGHCAGRGARVLVLLNAWLDSGADAGARVDWQTVNYWAMRLQPLWAASSEEGEGDSDSDDEGSGDEVDEDEVAALGIAGEARVDGDAGRSLGDEILVVICNRCGEENGTTFAGSSSLFSLTPGSGRPRLLHVMGRREEGLAVWTYPSEK